MLEQLLHLLVGIAAVGADDGVDDAMGAHLCILVEQEDHAVAELLFVGTQRAHEVAEVLGQHGDGSVDEIDGGGSLLCFLVDDGAFGDVVRDVGDVDAYFVEVVLLSDRQGIVVVLGIVWVDGAGPHIAEVLALGKVFLGDHTTDFLRCFLHLLRVLIGQAILCEDGMHLGIVLALAAEDVDDLAHHVAMRGVGPLCDAH